jgi:glucosamine--fructose-6-phosphate aminotransferase (isomerizing)
MCGIVGAVAERKISEIMLEGLKRLEYRGYDSAGLAVLENGQNSIKRLRTVGKVASLGEALSAEPLTGYTGIAHTRWATHGEPSVANAHPHCSSEQKIAVVHNGIIENHEALRQRLSTAGYVFNSETDTEVIVHLLDFYSKKEHDFVKVIYHAMQDLHGAYALGILNTATPNTLYAVRCGSPLVIGVGFDEFFIASDPLALLPVTQQFIYLEEGDVAVLTPSHLSLRDRDQQLVDRPVQTCDSDAETVSKGQYRHYMQKEIFEQPSAIIDTLNGHINNQRLDLHRLGPQAASRLAKIKNIQICACGTSYHAALVARQWFESLTKIPCQVEIASEFRYRDSVTPENSLFIALSQSGETADTLAALRSAKTRGFTATLGITNVKHSALAREADFVFATHAGSEIGVAATKTFTAQLLGLLVIALFIKQERDQADMNDDINNLKQLPKLLEKTLQLNDRIQLLAKQFEHKQHAIFLGRGVHYPIALEGALKLKEISYIHAEAYPAGELKHGPLALIDRHMPVVAIAPNDALFEKLESNLQEVQARQGDLILFLDEELHWPTTRPATVIAVPHCPELLTPIIYTLPLQLLAYHVAVLKGTDVDQPRNLAKSVTVE